MYELTITCMHCHKETSFQYSLGSETGLQNYRCENCSFYANSFSHSNFKIRELNTSLTAEDVREIMIEVLAQGKFRIIES